VIGIAIAAGVVVISLSPSLIASVKDDAAKGSIVAALLTLLGIVFSAMYGEISSYHKETSANIDKRRDLIFPLVQKHYYPWINAGNSLLNAFEQALSQSPVSQATATRVLYLTGLFYGKRLQFVIQGGGVVLLSSTKEGDNVLAAYRRFETSFQWAGYETPQRVSQVQKLCIQKDQPGNPYVLADFATEVAAEPTLRVSLERMTQWLSSKDSVSAGRQALSEFTTLFKTSIDKLYSAWW